MNDYLSVVDVSNPALPTLAGSVLFGVDVAPGAIGMVKEGSLIYVAAEVNGATGGLFVVDVSNPASPSVVGTLNVAALNGAGGVVKDGDYCYVSAGTTNDTVVIDVSDIGAMSVVASIDTGGATGGPIDKRFDFVYRSAPSSSYFSIIDWTELTAPTIAATLSHAGLSNSTMFALAGDYIYVAAVGTPGVTVLEIGYDED